MKAIILAAGVGARLGDIAKDTPKPMVPVGGIPVLHQTIDWLREGGYTDLFINIHHCAEKITSYFESGEPYGVMIHYSAEPELLGTAGGTKKIIIDHSLENESEPILIVYGDNLFPKSYDLASFLAFHKSHQGPVTIALAHNREGHDIRQKGVIEMKESRITRFIEKPSYIPDSDLINVALYLIDPRLAESFPDGNVDFSKNIFPTLLEQDVVLHGYVFPEPVGAIDTPELYEKENSRQ